MNFNEEIKAALKSSSLVHLNEDSSQVPMKGFDDKWIIIQKNTFTNWINEQLKRDPSHTTVANHSGATTTASASTSDEFVNDLQTDLCDGVKLVKLITILQQPNPKIPKRYFKKPINQHQCLENAQLALNAITEDGIKLVNIGNTDIHSGNLKLILGLIWHLILRYQIGKTKIPPKKLILAWLKAVLPECQINNLTSDLNNGIVLAGLINYCDSNLLPDWRAWNRNNKLENCRTAMRTAQSGLFIPLVVTPENMSSPELDELSAITYLSYFMKEGSPGYIATLKLIQSILTDEQISNFTTDWNDGWLLCKIASKMGANIAGFPNLDRTKKDQNCQLGIEGCRQIKIETYLSAKELSDPEVESIAVMATLVQFKYIKPMTRANEKAKVNINSKINAIVGKPLEFRIEHYDGEVKSIKAIVKGPNSQPSVGMVKSANGLACHFTPAEPGTHEINILCDNNLLDGCPFFITVKADTSKIQLITTAKSVSLYEPIEICVNPMGAGKGRVVVKMKSPTNREFSCPVEERDSKYYSKISPTEIGEWRASVYYDNEEVTGSSCIVDAFDPTSIEIGAIRGANNGIGLVNKLISFDVDVSLAGKGTLNAQLLVNNRQVPVSVKKKSSSEIAKDKAGEIYEVSFTPTQSGTHRCVLTFNNKQIKGSPIELNVLTEATQVRVLFEKCKTAQVNQLCSFTVETKDSGQGEVKCVISNPDGGPIQAKAINNQNGTWKIEYKPTDVGEYYIDVFYASQLTIGSPFKCNVFDPNRIKITPTLSGIVGQVIRFEVDASQAGTGQLEIAVNNGKIPCNFTNQGNLKFAPAFTPREAGKHVVSVKFNGIEVPDSPFYCQVVDLQRVSLLNHDSSRPYKFPINRQSSIELNVNETYNPSLEANLITPSGKSLPITRSITPNGNLKLSFVANEIGLHQLEITYADVAIAGSPLDIKIYDASRIIVSDVKGLEVNRISEFTIDATQGGEGQLEISINEGLVKNNVKQIKTGFYAVNFVPTKQDYYTVDVRFNGEVVPGCPKRVFVKDMQLPKVLGSPTENALFGSATSFNLGSVLNPSYLDVKIIAPSGEQIIPKIKQLNNEECKIEWTPFQLGTYIINILYADQAIKGSPLKVKIYDPKKVQVYNIQDGCVFKPNSFCVDASLAGEGSLEIGISSNGHFIPNQVKPLGNSKFEVHFLPQESVIHYANINFNGEAVKDSPFPIKIIDTNLVIAQGRAFGYIPTYAQTSFQVLTNGAGAGQVRATVTGIYSKKERKKRVT